VAVNGDVSGSEPMTYRCLNLEALVAHHFPRVLILVPQGHLRLERMAMVCSLESDLEIDIPVG
jgi:hypothetical protein